MMAPCEKPTSTVAWGVTPVCCCQPCTAFTNKGMASNTRAGRLSSVTPATENHCQPWPKSEANGACTLMTAAFG